MVVVEGRNEMWGPLHPLFTGREGFLNHWHLSWVDDLREGGIGRRERERKVRIGWRK